MRGLMRPCASVVLLILVLTPLGALAALCRSSIAVLAACGRNVALMMPCPTTSAPRALRWAFRPARGRPSLYVIPFRLSHHRRLGNSANVRGAVRLHAVLFGDVTVNFVVAFGGGAAPGVAPTPQKRGPWRLLATSRQGRLPTSRAPPRRGIPRYQVHYKNFLNAVLLQSCETDCATLAMSVVAETGVPLSAGRAMVAGMAMASAAAMLPNWGHVVDMYGIKYPQGTSDTANVIWEAPADAGLMISSFTPLHTAVLGAAMITYDMVVWGSFPRWTVENLLPPPVTALAVNVAWMSSPALTSWRPPWPARACILGRA